MSEISSYQTSISIPSLEQRTSLAGNIIDEEPRAAILKRALELVAEDYRGEIVSSVSDCDGNEIPCLLGVKTNKCPRGLGVVVKESGKVSFVYDAYGDTQGWGRRIAGEISANYNAIAMRLALQSMNLDVYVEERKVGAGQRLICMEGSA